MRLRINQSTAAIFMKSPYEEWNKIPILQLATDLSPDPLSWAVLILSVVFVMRKEL